MLSDTSQNSIRELAYEKWEHAGWPQGDGVTFWLEAEHELHHRPKSLQASIDAQDYADKTVPDADPAPLKMSKSSVTSRKKVG